MKIAVTSQGNTLESSVDPRFGRAAGFVVYDDDSDEFTYIDNDQNLQLAQGAGIQAAQNVAATGARTVVTGHVGPKAFMALKQGGIEVFLGAAGNVGQALQAYKDKKLQPADAPDKDSHW